MADAIGILYRTFMEARSPGTNQEAFRAYSEFHESLWHAAEGLAEPERTKALKNLASLEGFQRLGYSLNGQSESEKSSGYQSDSGNSGYQASGGPDDSGVRDLNRDSKLQLDSRVSPERLRELNVPKGRIDQFVSDHGNDGPPLADVLRLAYEFSGKGGRFSGVYNKVIQGLGYSREEVGQII